MTTKTINESQIAALHNEIVNNPGIITENNQTDAARTLSIILKFEVTTGRVKNIAKQKNLKFRRTKTSPTAYNKMTAQIVILAKTHRVLFKALGMPVPAHLDLMVARASEEEIEKAYRNWGLNGPPQPPGGESR